VNRPSDLGEYVMASDPSHDFDFLIGSWKVRHHRLKERPAGNTEWVEFDGTCKMQSILGGAGNVDDNLFEYPDRRLSRIDFVRLRSKNEDVGDMVAGFTLPRHARCSGDWFVSGWCRRLFRR
jgi:hypothetical protein